MEVTAAHLQTVRGDISERLIEGIEAKVVELRDGEDFERGDEFLAHGKSLGLVLREICLREESGDGGEKNLVLLGLEEEKRRGGRGEWAMKLAVPIFVGERVGIVCQVSSIPSSRLGEVHFDVHRNSTHGGPFKLIRFSNPFTKLLF